jgi:hypothetical protein
MAICKKKVHHKVQRYEACNSKYTATFNTSLTFKLKKALDVISSYKEYSNYVTDWTSGESWFHSRRGQEIFPPPKGPDRLCYPFRLLFKGYRKLSWGKALWLRKNGARPPLPHVLSRRA